MQQNEKAIESYFESEIQLIIFTINNIEYAIDIKNVVEIIQFMLIFPLPNAPGFIEGVINLRGKVIPVVDLRERFQSTNRETTRRTRIMMTSIQDKEIGLITDTVLNESTLKSMYNAVTRPHNPQLIALLCGLVTAFYINSAF